MNNYYANTAEITRGSAHEPSILLAPEQITPQRRAKSAKNEQNIIIRLANSIKKYGILEPLAVKPANSSSGFPVYELIDGERRYRAAALAEISKLPCTILPYSDPKCLQLAEINRICGEKLHFFALAEALSHLIGDYGMTQEEVARRMGLSQSAIANKLRLLKFPPEERRLIVSGGLTERHARAFLQIFDPAERATVITTAQKDKLNVAQTEALIALYIKSNTQESPTAEDTAISPCKNQEADAPTEVSLSFRACQGPQSTPANALRERGEEKGVIPRESPFLPSKTPLIARQSSITPRKFALRDLQPLYNSIERTLGIFQKTGAAAEYYKEEDEDAARIVIYIPKHG